jgi:hypothetical protein
MESCPCRKIKPFIFNKNMDQPTNQINNQRLIDYIKIATNIFLIICFLIGTYYYLAYTNQVNEALTFKEPNSLIELYQNYTGQYCICYNSLKEIPVSKLITG